MFRYALLLAFLMSGFDQSYAAMRGPVVVQDSTVLTDTFQPLRCSHIFMYEGTVAAMEFGLSNSEIEARWEENETYVAKLVNDYAFNCIRVAVWHYRLQGPQQSGGEVPGSNGSEYWSVYSARAQSLIQRYVDLTAKLGIYMILNEHSSYGSPLRNGVVYEDSNQTVDGLDNAKAFWSLYGTRFKDQSHVLFELINEPDEAVEDRTNMIDLYRHVRGLAPDSHLILWSYNGTFFLEVDDLEASRASDGIDYTNASVGFHTYELDGLFSWERAREWQLAGFPVIATEFQSYRDPLIEKPASLPHYLNNLLLAERLGVGWTGWMYEASIQSRYLDSVSQTTYPENFLVEAERHGVDIAGMEKDNVAQRPGVLPTVELNLDEGLVTNQAVVLSVSSSNADRVRYYAGNSLIGQSEEAPEFAFTWNADNPGQYKISARAESVDGVFNRSAPITVVVYNSDGIVIDNEGFENGGQRWYGARAIAAPSSEAAYQGQYSLKYEDPDSKPSSGKYGANIELKQLLRTYGPGDYRLEYAIRTVSGEGEISPKLFTEDAFASTRFTREQIDETWREFSSTITIEWETGNRPAYLNFRSPSERSFYLDQVSLRKMSETAIPAPVESIPPTPREAPEDPAASPTPTPTLAPTSVPTPTPTSQPTTVSSPAPTQSPAPNPSATPVAQPQGDGSSSGGSISLTFLLFLPVLLLLHKRSTTRMIRHRLRCG